MIEICVTGWLWFESNEKERITVGIWGIFTHNHNILWINKLDRLVLFLFFLQNYQKNGFPLTDLQQFLREPKRFPVVDDDTRTDVQVTSSTLCSSCFYCQRYDWVKVLLILNTMFNLCLHTQTPTQTHTHTQIGFQSCRCQDSALISTHSIVQLMFNLD